jgi:hypothetical protein
MKSDFDAIFYYVSDLERAIKFHTDVLVSNSSREITSHGFLSGAVCSN